MEYFDEFETLARKIQAERKLEEYYRYNSLEFKAESIMVDFRLWCYANEKDDKDEKLFKKNIEDKPHICFWIRKYIAEKYWNYKYTYNYEKNKWIADKIITKST